MTLRLFFFFFACVPVSCSSQNVKNHIVLVNIGSLDRKGIADEIAIIASLNPKVIALDVQFSRDTDMDSDTKLIQALDKCKNLVMASVIENYTSESISYKRFTLGSLPDYLTNSKTGFVNSIREQDEFKTQKRFSLFEMVGPKKELHFAVQTAMLFDSVKVNSFINKNPQIVGVNLDSKENFKTFSSFDILNEKVCRNDIEGKIVLIGFLGPGNEDKFFSPMNKKVYPYEPDMYGLEFHAYIVLQILK